MFTYIIYTTLLISLLVYMECLSQFPLQQAFNATAVVRHMRRLQLGTSHEGPNPTLPGQCRTHLLMPEEDAGAGCDFSFYPLSYFILISHTHGSVKTSFSCVFSSKYWWCVFSLSVSEACSEGGCSQNVDSSADPLSNCTYRCHPTSRVWPLLLLQLSV